MNKFKLTVVIVLAVLIQLAFFATGDAYAKSIVSTSKKVSKSKVIKKPTPTPKKVIGKKVLGVKTIKPIFPILSFIACNMPDGKIIKATKKDCDAVNAFWNSHKPSNPGPSNGGGNSGSNNSNPTPPSLPIPQIDSVNVAPCTSSSCGFITTVIINGSNFTGSTRASLVNGGTEYSVGNSSAQYVGGNSSTQIIMDFYNAPCGVYDLKTYSISEDVQTVTNSNAVVIPCI